MEIVPNKKYEYNEHFWENDKCFVWLKESSRIYSKISGKLEALIKKTGIEIWKGKKSGLEEHQTKEKRSMHWKLSPTPSSAHCFCCWSLNLHFHTENRLLLRSWLPRLTWIIRPALCSPVQVLSLSYDLILSSKEKKKWRDSHIKSHCQDKMCVLVRVQSSQHTWTVIVGSTVLNAHMHPVHSEPQIIHIIDTIPQPRLSLVQPSDLWLSGLIHSLDHLHTHFLHDNTWPDLVFRWDTLLLFASCLGQSFLLPFFPIAEAVSFSLPDRMPLLLKPCL